MKGDDGIKKKKREGNTFKSGIRSESEETRRNAIIAAKDNLTGGSFPPRLLFAVRPRFFLSHLLSFLFFNTSFIVFATRRDIQRRSEKVVRSLLGNVSHTILLIRIMLSITLALTNR